MPDDDMPSTRPGSGADLSRRIERLEHNYGELAATVSRVEITLQHGDELNRLRFASLEGAINSTGKDIAKVSTDLEGFMARIEGLISGEIQTSATRQGAELVADYQKWRREVDNDRSRLALIGRIAVLLVTSNVLAWAAAIYAVTRP